MEKAGVRHQVRLASGSRGRGLFPTGPVGWTDSAMLLSVPLDVCICAPFGDEDLFTIDAVIEIGPDTSLVRFKKSIERLEKKLGVDIVVSDHERVDDDH